MTKGNPITAPAVYHNGEGAAAGDLVLDSLEIRNYRLFDHLTIPRLGRVNLMAGNNNVGKSCLLEALWLYARQGDPAVVWRLLQNRHEIGLPSAIGETVAERTVGIKYLFHGRPPIDAPIEPIVVGSIDDPSNRLTMGVSWYVTGKVDGERMLHTVSPAQANKRSNATLRWWAQLGEAEPSSYLFSSDLFRGKSGVTFDCLECVPLLTESISLKEVGRLWDMVSQTKYEEDVLDALRIIMPEVETVTIPQDHGGLVRPGGHIVERNPYIKLRGVDTPMPIGSLGSGMQRVLITILALMNAKNGFLLIDEIERSLHLSVQAELWRLIFKLARQLNAQVFATTHSWDCFEAFQEAAGEDERYEDGMLIVLRRDGDVIESELFTGEELATVPREQVEI